mmetsp:Transcript_31701/g.82731  ORF Transcript_31701/g.82731 Transcript_31701/m.82731 type:complete len:206 (-) Transcript_31701:963-1580(-)
MASFLQLIESKSALLDTFFFHQKQAEKCFQKVHIGVSKFQAAVRSFAVRKRIKLLRHSAVAVQRLFRGYLGKLRFREALTQQQRIERQKFFNFSATQIQKLWRGFFSRKYIHHLQARRKFVDSVVAKNAAFQQELRDYYEQELKKGERIREEKKEQEFEEILSHLHHLISTSSAPGVFSSPFTGPAIALDLPIEEHLKRIQSVRT